MSGPVTTTEFPADFPAHKAMWQAYTKFVSRGIIGVIVTIVVVGWLTGVL